MRRATSKVPGAGVGVTVARGSVERGSLVALYPGMAMAFNLFCAKHIASFLIFQVRMLHFVV